MGRSSRLSRPLSHGASCPDHGIGGSVRLGKARAAPDPVCAHEAVRRGRRASGGRCTLAAWRRIVGGWPPSISPGVGAGYSPCPPPGILELGLANVRGLETLGAACHLELYLVTFRQTLEALRGDGAKMDENVLAA